jgi:uncharacterized protein YoxC
MKTLAATVVVIGLCFIAQPVYAQGATFCQQFVVTGSSLTLGACIQGLDRDARIVEDERAMEVIGVSMSKVDLTKAVKDLQRSVHDIEQKTVNVDLDAQDINILDKATDDLRDRVKGLEDTVNSQATLFEGARDLKGRVNDLEDTVRSQARLLDEQKRAQEDLQKQIDTIRAGLAPKPRAHVKKATTPQKPSGQ